MDNMFEAVLLSEIRKERGANNEFELFEKFYEKHRNYIEKFTDHVLRNSGEKDNVKSENLRKCGNSFYQKGKFEESITVFTESLSYATSNGKEYGLALANRSAVLFHLEDYENCIKDLELCLKTHYPLILKPKMYIRLTKCYSHIGKRDKMQETLKTCIEFVKTLTDKKVIDSYNENIQEMVKNMTVKEVVLKKKYDLMPALDENPLFANASKYVNFRYSTTLGPHVVAAQDINCGDTIFVEKAFTVAMHSTVASGESLFFYNCHYCVKAVISCIPCKGCVGVLYCSEKCLDDDWTNYHKWECQLYKTDFISVHRKLALRILIKAGESAFINNKVDFTNESAPYNDKNEAYKCIANLPVNVVKFKKTNVEAFRDIILDSMLIVQYLKSRTDFIAHLKQFPSTKHIKNELVNKIGGLMLRFGVQMFVKMFRLMGIETKGLNFYEQCNGRGIFPFASQLTHSCFPNTFEYFIEDTVVIKAARQIKSGDIVHRSYFKFRNSGGEMVRETQLQMTSFKCKCDICTGKSTVKRSFNKMKCTFCQGNALILNFPTVNCEDCEQEYQMSDNVMEIMKLSFQVDDGVKTLKTVADATSYFTLFSTIYQPFHQVFEGLYNATLKICGKNGLDTEFLKIATKAINYNKTRCGDVIFDHGVYLTFVCSTIISLINNNGSIEAENLRTLINEAKMLMAKAREIISLYCPHILSCVDNLDQALLEICVKSMLILTDV